MKGNWRIETDQNGIKVLQRRTHILSIPSWETAAKGDEIADVFCAICGSMPADKPWASGYCTQECRRTRI